MRKPRSFWNTLGPVEKATILAALRESREELFGVLQADLEALNGFAQWRDTREAGEYASLLVEARAYADHIAARVEEIDHRDALIILLDESSSGRSPGDQP